MAVSVCHFMLLEMHSFFLAHGDMIIIWYVSGGDRYPVNCFGYVCTLTTSKWMALFTPLAHGFGFGHSCCMHE